MHAALWQLLWMDFRGSLRVLFDARKNWRQLVLLVLMLGFLGLMLAARTANPVNGSRFGDAMPFWALIYLLLTWLTASADRGLVMRPAEIHYVAGGPFHDWEVLSLNLIRLAYRALISATVLSLLATVYVDSYPSALAGLWMLIAVSLLVGMIASLSAKRSHSKWIKWAHRLMSLTAVILLWALVSQALAAARASGRSPSISVIASSTTTTPLGEWILPPLAWMFAPISAPGLWPDTLLMLPARLGVIGLLVGLVYLLGGNYLEAATTRTDLSLAKRRAALRSGSGPAPTAMKRMRVPYFGRWGGAGSIAWMQTIHAIRIMPRFFMFTTAIVGLVLVLPLMVDRQRLDGTAAIGWMVGLTAYADFLLLLQLPVGFLGPVAQRESLKALPLATWRVVIGQLAGPVVPLALVHSLVCALFLYLLPSQMAMTLQTAGALVPVGLVLIANVNLLGCWNIIRPRALQQRDAFAAGRAMASVWIYMAMLLPAIFLAILGSLLISNLVLPGFPGYALGASIGMLLALPIYLGLLVRSFARWQPTSGAAGQEEQEYDR